MARITDGRIFLLTEPRSYSNRTGVAYTGSTRSRPSEVRSGCWRGTDCDPGFLRPAPKWHIGLARKSRHRQRPVAPRCGWFRPVGASRSGYGRIIRLPRLLSGTRTDSAFYSLATH